MHRRVILIIAVLAAACSRPEKPATSSAFPDAPVILISIDTLRADHLPAYGYDGLRTPNIDALRADGVLFTAAYSHVPLTLPSHVSLMTGTLPNHNGVRDNIGYRLAPGRATLPTLLKSSGYATGAAVSAYVLRRDTGLGPLFDDYDDAMEFTPDAELGAIQRRGDATAAAASAWIEKHRNGPFFFFLHLFEPHTPYDPPEPYRSSTANAYDGEIAYTDAILGRFLDGLKANGTYDRAIIILLSDHGEGLGDHGEDEHGIFLYREALHVPLVVKLPSRAAAGTTISEPVGLTDVLPTVLSLTGAKIPDGLDGSALLGPAATPRTSARRVFAETLYPRLHLGWSDLQSLVDGTHHYIAAPRAELYALTTDPGERKNILAEERRVAASFRKALDAYPRKITTPSAASAEEASKLKSLGYISAPAGDAGGPRPDPKDGIVHYREYVAASAALARGDSSSAITGLKRVLDTNPQFADAAIALARAYEAADQFDRAAETYRNLLVQNPALVEQVALGAGTAYLNAGKLGDARAHAELALRSNPAAAHLLLGRIALAAGDPRQARREAQEVERFADYRAHAILLDAQALLTGGEANAASALEELDRLKASRNGAPLAGLESNRANALMYLGRAPEALAAFKSELAHFPTNRDAWGRLASVYLIQGNVASAEAVLRDMAAAIPAPSTYAFAADILEHFGRRDAAREWRQRAR